MTCRESRSCIPEPRHASKNNLAITVVTPLLVSFVWSYVLAHPSKTRLSLSCELRSFHHSQRWSKIPNDVFNVIDGRPRRRGRPSGQRHIETEDFPWDLEEVSSCPLINTIGGSPQKGGTSMTCLDDCNGEIVL